MLMDINYFKDTFHLNLDNTTPLYQQLYDYFKRLILTGILKEGDQMLPEVSICETLNISRSTVRKTMEMLIEDGYLIRRRGKGSFIASPKLKRNINYLYNFSENMQNIDVTPSSCVLECTVLEHVDDHIKEALKLPDSNTKVFLLKRIRKGIMILFYVKVLISLIIYVLVLSPMTFPIILYMPFFLKSIYLFLTMPQKVLKLFSYPTRTKSF